MATSETWSADPIESISGITFRRVTVRDWPSLQAGFREAFAADRGVEDWEWKCGPTFEHVVGMLAVDADDQLLAYYGCVCFQMQIDGQVSRVGQIVDVYRLRREGTADRMVFSALVHEFAHRNGAEGWCDIMYGFPGPRHAAIGSNRLGYGDGNMIPYFVRDTSWTYSANYRTFTVGDELTAAHVDGLWARAAHRYPIAVVRDADFFAYRYWTKPNAGYEFRTVVKGDDVCAIVVLQAGADTVKLIDLVWDGADPDALRLADVAIADFAARQGTSTIEMMIAGDVIAERILVECGWQAEPNPLPITFAWASFGPRVSADDAQRRMYITYGDTDLV